MKPIFVDTDPTLGHVPGPLAIAVDGERIWLAGGGRGESAVLCFDEAWESMPGVSAGGLRAVLSLGDRAVVCGERGYLAFVDPTGVELLDSGTQGCLYALVRDAAGDIWIGGDDGFLGRLRDRRIERMPCALPGRLLRLAVLEGELWIGTSHGLACGDRIELATTTAITGVAMAPDGTFAVTADGGGLWLADGAEFRRIEAPAIDLESIVYDPAHDRFVVGGQDGYLATLALDGTLVALPALSPAYRIAALAPYRGDMLAGGWRQTGAPYRFVGALYYDGTEALDVVDLPPRYAGIPPRRTRSFEIARSLTLADAQDLSLAEAQAKLTALPWPDTTQLERCRFFDGDLHVATTRELLAETERRGFCVAITGNLIVDGALAATAGGDGYDSVLMVGGNVWAEAAIFRYGIQCVIGGDLEVATVIVCSRGDDGGYVAATRVRAQVVAYALYFSPPEDADALMIGNVYGEQHGFAPSRSAEVFVPGVLEEGVFDDDLLGTWLAEGKPVIREA